MADDIKPLGIQHAKITGQVMRDHWGPIVERIADEIADPRDAFINELITENERLREALRQIANIIPPIQTTIARAALGETK
jgi:hypothetical protein